MGHWSGGVPNMLVVPELRRFNMLVGIGVETVPGTLLPT